MWRLLLKNEKKKSKYFHGIEDSINWRSVVLLSWNNGHIHNDVGRDCKGCAPGFLSPGKDKRGLNICHRRNLCIFHSYLPFAVKFQGVYAKHKRNRVSESPSTKCSACRAGSRLHLNDWLNFLMAPTRTNDMKSQRKFSFERIVRDERGNISEK